MKKALIIIPTYNEVDTISNLINTVFSVSKGIKNWQIEILVADSKSPDNTASIVRKMQKTNPRLHLMSIKKEGLGKAYIHGFTFALKKLKVDVVFEMDADFSHDPKSIPQFLAKIDEGADFVIGSRYIPGGSIPQEWSFDRKFFSVIGNLVIRLGFMKLKVTDWTSGYRAIKPWVIESSLARLKKYSGYVFQVALLDESLKKNAKIQEIPIKFIDRQYGVSKINTFQYMFQTLFYVFTHSSFIRYVIVGVTGAVIDFGLSYIFIEKVMTTIWLATLISTESAIISNFLLNNFWSFSHKKLEGTAGAISKKFLNFNLISSGAILIQTVGIHTLSTIFGEQLWFVYKFFILAFIVIPYSYILYNKIIWKSK